MTTWTTYTVLVTIAHDGDAPNEVTVSRHIQAGLEEGTENHDSVYAAAVDAFAGDRLDRIIIDRKNPLRDSLPAKNFHNSFQRGNA